MTIVPRDYRNQSFALGSMHGKQRAILPALRRHLAARVLLTRALDTDSFGTFTGETRRCGSMRDAARSKARAAIDEVGVPLGLGNEGSFGPHPAIPFAACDAEILLLVDARDGREIHESVLSIRTNFAYMICRPGDDLTDFLARIGFPAHALVAMPNNPSDGFRAIKGLADPIALHRAIVTMADHSMDGRACVMTDMRADRNPTRMAIIRSLATRLALRLRRRCPGCGAAGFGITEAKRGLPCACCGTPVPLAVARLVRCDLCRLEIEESLPHVPATADPQHCGVCNP